MTRVGVYAYTPAVLLTLSGLGSLAHAADHAPLLAARTTLRVPTCRGVETFELDGHALLDERAPARPRGQRADARRARGLAEERATLTSTVIVRSRDRAALDALLAPHGMRSARADAGSGELPGFYTLRCCSLADAAALAEQLNAHALRNAHGIDEVYLDTEPAWSLRGVPTDPDLPLQWHLINTITSPAYDINADAAWNLGFTGTGVTVAVAEYGFETTHDDLAANFNAAASQTDNGGPSSPHGTSVAGLIAANNNTVGGVGVAFDAQLARIYIGSAQTNTDAFLFRNDLNAVKSNSWGPNDDPFIDFNSTIEKAALQTAVTNGRGGRGTVFVWAAGNGGLSNDRVDYDPYASSRYTIAVGAIDTDDQRSTYSEPGASLMVVAPSDSIINNATDIGLYTTTAGNTYTSIFGGTSAAAPVVAGVAALILDANPLLTWRDVQHVLIRSARKCDPTDPAWTTNGAGRSINGNFGFGAVDAGAAVALASTWTNVEPEISASETFETALAITIPDNASSPLLTSISLEDDLLMEAVELTLTVSHMQIGDLRVELISPDGTVSTFATPRGDPTDNYGEYVFTSLRCWGEHAAGTWTLRITDEITPRTGSLVGWSITAYGTPVPACPCDFNDSGSVDVADLFAYINAWLAKAPAADFNDSGNIDVADLFAYINCWLAKC